MPLKIISPRSGKTPYYSVRGTHLGVYLDRSTKTGSRAEAARFLKLWKDEIDRGAFAKPGEPTFLDAAVPYMAANNDRFLEPIMERIGAKPIRQITQDMIDNLAISLYPKATPATRNRQVYTPISAVLKHAGVKWDVRWPKGWRGHARTEWLEKDPAFRLLAKADEEDEEFGLFLRFLLYSGLRLSEALSLKTDDLSLADRYAQARNTKNATEMSVHLTMPMVAALANHPRGIDRPGEKLFRFTKCGRLYARLGRAKKAAGPQFGFVGFHTFRHTYGAWMRRYGGLDTTGLLATQRWKDAASARRYEHAVTSEESRKADLLPVENLRIVASRGK